MGLNFLQSSFFANEKCTMPMIAGTRTKKRRKQLQFLVLGAAGAGKTSLLRRFFHGQFTYKRSPTVGADFYVGRVPNSTTTTTTTSIATGASPTVGIGNTTLDNQHNDSSIPMSSEDIRNDEDDYCLVQIWDTPGKENFAMQQQFQASLQDSFFEHADAIMLVYDMTSSTSFTRLLRWYADLLELFQRSGTNGTSLGSGIMAQRKPILLVANKLDLFEQIVNPRQGPRIRVSQRDVLGLQRNFYGNDFQYEYSVVSPLSSSTTTTTVHHHSNINNNKNHNHTQQQPAPPLSQQKSPTNNNIHTQRNTKRHAEISSYFYLANRDNWTSDFSYLESLITAEDGSHPDREMVLLWCMRNSVQLYEVSAATGEGVTQAFVALVKLAAEAKQTKNRNYDNNNNNMNNHNHPHSNGDDCDDNNTLDGPDDANACAKRSQSVPHNKELDLRDLYKSPQTDALSCCCVSIFALFPNCFPKQTPLWSKD